MKYKILLGLIFNITFQLSAENAVDKLINNSLLQNANISLLVKDLNQNKTLYEYRSKNSLVPASTMKLVTTASAVEMLGADFRFETKLEIDGEITKDSTLKGNLYIRGGGDPTLGSSKIGDIDFLTKWIEAIRKAGIKNIKGHIVADQSIFEMQVINPKWTWEDMGNYYAPGIHGISYLDNTYKLIFRSGKIGANPDILRTEPEIPNLTFQNFVKATSTTSDNAYFYGAPFSNERTIYGEIPANKNEFVVKGDIPNPALLLAQHLHAKLIETGSQITELPIAERCETCKKFSVFTHFSPPLSEIINEINVNSNNHFAEYVFKYLSLKNDKTGTNEVAKESIRTFWKGNKLPVDQLFQSDGSGLSPTNAVSAQFFVDLLTYMKTKSKNNVVFYNSLPVSGESGTLKQILEKTKLTGKVHAKSGTIARVKCYAGFIETNTTTLVFAILINNASGTSKEVTKKMEQFMLDVTR